MPQSTGGKFIAGERGAFEIQEEAVTVEPTVFRAPLIERLSHESLAALATAVNSTVSEIISRACE